MLASSRVIQPHLRRSLWSLVALGAALFAVCGVWPRYNAARVVSPGPSARQPVGVTSALGQLWKAPAFSLRDQHNATVSLPSLAGHVWIADFIFTTCQAQCPLLSAKLVLLQRKLSNPALRFVSFSVDPVHDTPSALADYARTWNKGEWRWLLLSTEASSLSAISAGMHVAVGQSENAKSPISHTSQFFLVDAAGTVRASYDSDDPVALSQLRADAITLLQSSPPVDSAGLPSSGAALFQAVGCPGCHGNQALAPALAGLWNSSVLLAGERRVVADDAYLRDSIAMPGAKLVAGYLNIMPAYAGELSPQQIDALVAYVRTLPATRGGAATAAAASGTALAALGITEADSLVLAVDPVCGMAVRASKRSPHLTNGGRAYYFCSDLCRDKFAKSPGNYLNLLPTPMR